MHGEAKKAPATIHRATHFMTFSSDE